MILMLVAVLVIFSIIANVSHYILNWRSIYRQGGYLEKDSIDKESPITVVSPCKISEMNIDEIKSFRYTLEILVEKHNVKKIYIVIDENDSVERIEAIKSGKIEIIKLNRELIDHIARIMGSKPLYGKTQALIAGTLQAFQDNSLDPILYIDCDNLVNPRSIDIVSKKIIEAELITGYRWYVLDSFKGILYNLVSSIAFEGMGFYTSRIVWGGFMCIRGDLIASYGITRRWVSEFADDALVRNVFSSEKRKILFCPQCISLTPAPKTCFRDFLDWSRRQLYMIKLYTPRGYRLLLLGYLSITMVMAAPILLYIYAGLNIYTGIALIGLLTHILLGGLRGWRHYSISRSAWLDRDLPRRFGLIDKPLNILGYIALNSIKAPLILLILIDLFRVRKLVWRGVSYCIEKRDEGYKISRC